MDVLLHAGVTQPLWLHVVSSLRRVRILPCQSQLDPRSGTKADGSDDDARALYLSALTETLLHGAWERNTCLNHVRDSAKIH